MEERSEVLPLGVKAELPNDRDLFSDQGYVDQRTTPSPSSTDSSHQSSKTPCPAPGPSSQAAASPDPKAPADADMATSKENEIFEEEVPIDSDSLKGIFGWDTVDEISIPYLLRRGKKFVSVRIVECKLLSKYPNSIPEELAKKDPLVSHFITEVEANLLNEINTTHCDYEYGQSPFNEKDLIVDFEEFLGFFKIVKKNFPEDVLATMPSPEPVAQSPSASEPPQYCGWVQINNTVSPYIVRSDGKEQVKLVPLSVIVYAAGLLSGAHIEGLLPTIEECTMLNAACKTAGFEFVFGRNTRLIGIAEVIQRCQVQIFELPMSNPLQFAQYQDNRVSQPPPTSIFNSPIRQPPPYHVHMPQYANPLGMEAPPGAMLHNNPFVRTRYPAPRLPGAPPHIPGTSAPPYSRLPSIISTIGVDSKSIPNSMPQAMGDKYPTFDNMALNKLMSQSMHYPPVWPGQAPPAHKPIKGPPMPLDIHPPMSSSTSSSTSSYQPKSLPPSPLLHPSLTPPNMSHPIYRNSGPMAPPKDARYPSMQGSGSSNKQPVMLSQARYSPSPSSPSFGVNQFNSSLFARSESSEQHHRQKTPVSTPSPSSASPSSPHPSNHQNRSNNTTTTSTLSHMLNSPNKTSKNTHPYTSLVNNISACLVMGKSISCLTMNSPSRKGQYCLVEAVSKLYFPTIPIWEFVKVLQAVLRATLYQCTPEEEAAFVQYYNLPVPKLKCNKMIMVYDLQNFFPQLNYVFNKRLSDQVAAVENAAESGVKRPRDGSQSGPPAKQQVVPKLENVVQKLHQDKRPSSGDPGGPSSNASASVIVIDD